LRADVGISALLNSVDRLQKLGADGFSADISGAATLQQRLANAICGVDDEPFACDWPSGPEGVGAYLRLYEERWRLLEGPPPANLDDRVRRLYALLLRARLEAQFGKAGG
jgi:hypothetical protein